MEIVDYIDIDNALLVISIKYMFIVYDQLTTTSNKEIYLQDLFRISKKNASLSNMRSYFYGQLNYLTTHYCVTRIYQIKHFL